MSKTRAEGNTSGNGHNWENSSLPASAEDTFQTYKVSMGGDCERTSSLFSSSKRQLPVLLETAVIGVSNGKDEAYRGIYFFISFRNNLTLWASLQVVVE